MESVLLVLGGIVGVTLLVLYGAFVGGFILYKMWYWFLIPVFPMLPHISINEAIGISLFLSLIKSYTSKEYSYNGTEIKQKVDWASAFITPWLVLLFAWVIKLFI
jgi:hypothetical protein